MEDWKHVIWSDETKINRFELDGRKYVWKKKDQPLLDREIDPTVKYGEEISWYGAVWGGMEWESWLRLRGG